MYVFVSKYVMYNYHFIDQVLYIYDFNPFVIGSITIISKKKQSSHMNDTME